MPFCPKCRVEYRDGFAICADCDEKLVAVLPPEEVETELETDDEADLDWMAMSRLNSHQYAEMIRSRLEELNIPVVILSKASGQEMSHLMGIASPFHLSGGYVIMVPRKYSEIADLEGEAILGGDWVKGKLLK
jgi:hypothetical protein